jgi:hypothetical protein
MAEELLNRIDSVANFLEAVKGQDCYDKAWVMQEAQLETCIKGAGLDVRHAGQIAMALKRLPKPERLTQVLSEAMMSTPMPSSSSHRKELQNFCGLHNYFTEEQWNTLFSSDVASNGKLECILRHAARLGLKNPTEPTIQALCALYLLVAETGEEMSAPVKLETAKVIKRKCKDVVVDAVQCHVAMLPLEPGQFKATHPQLWNNVFGDSVPVQCRLPEGQFMRMQASIPMRVTRTDARASSSAPMVLQTNFGGGAEKMAGFMMQQMQAIMQQSQQIMQNCCGGGGSTFGARPLIALQDDVSNSGLRVLNRLNSRIRHEPDMSAIRDAPVREQLAAAMAPPHDEAVARSAQETAAAALSEAAPKVARSVQETTAAVLSAMEASKAKAKAKAKAAAKAKATATPATTAKPKAKATTAAPKPTKVSKAASLKVRPFGCGKCRGKQGCTASCVKSNTTPLTKPYVKK